MDRAMAMIPTIICKILMPLDTFFPDTVFIQNKFHFQSIFKKVSTYLVLK
jgi:hypothetical protein